MKKISILLVTLFACLGCTTYNTEIKNNSYAPVASMQILRNAPLMKTAESILLKNNGEVIHLNFTKERDEYFKGYLKQIYSGITAFRNLDALETA